MGQRQKDWARRKRDELFIIIGRQCARCPSTTDLEFDVIIPVGNDDHHRRYSWDQRMTFYWRQYEDDNLQVLCKSCNAIKGNNEDLLIRPF